MKILSILMLSLGLISNVEAGHIKPNTTNIDHIWASWCPSCVHELPSLDKFIGTHKEIQVRTFVPASDLIAAKALKVKLNLTNIDIQAISEDDLIKGGTKALPTTKFHNVGGGSETVVGAIEWELEGK